MLLSTMEEPAGMMILTVHGLVIGTEARPLNPFMDGVKRLMPQQERDFPVRLVQSRMAAVTRMISNARAMDANGILGVRFDHRNISATWMELCAYGTAVTLARIPSQRRGEALYQAYDEA